MVKQQQAMGEQKGVVLEGRDIGTVVMPDAEVKFFITAEPRIRAERRLNELKTTQPGTTLADVLQNILERDRLDSNRSVSPLRQAEDAIVLDNSLLTEEEQFQFLLTNVRKVLVTS